jgi:hypothetical protein
LLEWQTTQAGPVGNWNVAFQDQLVHRCVIALDADLAISNVVGEQARERSSVGHRRGCHNRRNRPAQRQFGHHFRFRHRHPLPLFYAAAFAARFFTSQDREATPGMSSQHNKALNL